MLKLGFLVLGSLLLGTHVMLTERRAGYQVRSATLIVGVLAMIHGAAT